MNNQGGEGALFQPPLPSPGPGMGMGLCPPPSPPPRKEKRVGWKGGRLGDPLGLGFPSPGGSVLFRSSSHTLLFLPGARRGGPGTGPPPGEKCGGETVFHLRVMGSSFVLSPEQGTGGSRLPAPRPPKGWGGSGGGRVEFWGEMRRKWGQTGGGGRGGGTELGGVCVTLAPVGSWWGGAAGGVSHVTLIPFTRGGPTRHHPPSWVMGPPQFFPAG